mmetsp:Transcript_45287/g.114013  ORF Transcript_45287/g.114013 Transcript_45287/m.114013 type:complete len:318 (+) Transcript_45287:82-1035(+)
MAHVKESASGLIPQNHVVIVPTYTPLDATGKLNVAVVERQADLVHKGGANCVFVNGTTGESVSLTVEERKKVAEEWVAKAAGRFKVIIQIGCDNVADACELGRHAQHIGADAFSAFCPHYYRPANSKVLVSTMAEIASSAPNLPFYYYHFPGMTRVDLPMSEFMRLAYETKSIPNLKGAKFTHIDLEDFSVCTTIGDGAFEMWAGYGYGHGLGAAVMGSRGAFAFSYCCKPYRHMIQLLEAGEFQKARDLQAELVKLNQMLSALGPIPAGKELLRRLYGIDCGTVRLPLTPLEGPQLDHVSALAEFITHLNTTYPGL